MKYLYYALLLTLYCACLWSLRPSVHVESLDGPVSTCKNPYHNHK